MAADLYSVLGVARTASDDEIKRAYRAAVKSCHPDLHPGDEQKAELMMFTVSRPSSI